jgi:hypothetical protein
MNGLRLRRNGIILLGGAFLLAGCGADPSANPQRAVMIPTTATTSPGSIPATSSSSTPSPSPASPAAAAASPGLMDGNYRLSADPQCGEFAMDGSSLVMRSGKATLTPSILDGGQPASGTVTTKGNNLQIHVANGTAAIIDLTATASTSGTLSGSGQSGGLHLSGETGWVCQFTFTATRDAATGTTGPVENVGTFYSPTKNVSCQLLPDSVYCQTRTPPRSVKMTTDGSYKVCEGCLGDPGEHTPVLAYGNSTQVGPFKCVSESSGVTCTTGGKGFSISRSGVVKLP